MEEIRRKHTFWRTLIVCLFLIQALCTIVLAYLKSVGIWSITPGIIGILIGPNFLLSSYIATVLCKRKGIASECHTIEVLIDSSAEVILPSVEVRHDPAIWKRIGVTYGCFSVLVFLLAWFARSEPGTWLLGCAFGGMLSIVGAVTWYAGFKSWGFIARVDDEGITSSNGISRVFTPWEKVQSWALISEKNVLGVQIRYTVFINSKEGKRLATISLAGASESQVERFIVYLREKSSDRPATSPQ